MGKKKWWILGAMIVSGGGVVGCERGALEPGAAMDARLEEDDPRTVACYHFETSGAIEESGTCEEYTVRPNETGGWTITLVAPPVALVVEMPTSLAPGQYGVRSMEEAAEKPELIGVEVHYQPLDGQEESFGKDVTGTMTVMQLDEERVSALFDFGALPRSAATPEGIEVRGHLRELSLQR